jgi:hypothetical protein
LKFDRRPELTTRLLQKMSQIKRDREPALCVRLESYGELTSPPEPVPIRRKRI